MLLNIWMLSIITSHTAIRPWRVHVFMDEIDRAGSCDRHDSPFSDRDTYIAIRFEKRYYAARMTKIICAPSSKITGALTSSFDSISRRFYEKRNHMFSKEHPAARIRIVVTTILVSAILLVFFAAFDQPTDEKTKYKVEAFDAVVGKEPHTFIENTYLVYNTSTRDAVIIDPGSRVEKMEKRIDELELTVRAVLNTHGHHDHIGGNAFYSERYAVSIYGHHNEAGYYEGENRKQAPCAFVNVAKPLFLPGFAFETFHTPGHSPGSVCYYLDGLLFSGDTLFRESIGRTWGKTQEEEEKKTKQEIDSIKTELLPLPETTRVFPGHGASTTIGHEKKNNPFLK